MKKLLSLLLILVISFGLASCNNTTTERPPVDCELYPTHIDCLDDEELEVNCETDPDNELCEDETPVEEPGEFIDIYYINDFHGAIEPDGDHIGLAYIANFLVTKKEENPDNVIILAGGDILQGSALSNYYDGLSTINMLNEMHFDGFVVGNHEFDWGLDIITAYFDGDDTNGEANFPLLGANIYHEGTANNPDYVEPYTIIERSGLKIGIIGTIGYGLESSIATSKVAGYEFASPVPVIKEYTHYLRTVEEVDLVIVISHDPGHINTELAALTGDYKVNAIFNGHSHQVYAKTNLGIPTVQSGSYGEFIGHVRFTFDNGELNGYSAENIDFYDSNLFYTPNIEVQTLIDAYLSEIEPIFAVPIIIAGEDLSSGELTTWIAELMRVTTNSDIAFHNIGGTRRDIDEGTTITPGILYEVWPFDNFIKTVWLTGAQINLFKAASGNLYSTNIDTFDNDTYYKVATNDYLFDKEYYPFVDGLFPENTGLLLRDIATTELEMQNILYSSFIIDNDILSASLVPVVDPPEFSKRN